MNRAMIILLLVLSVSVASAASLPGQTFESLAKLPDFNGWWQPQLAAPSTPPLKPAGLAEFERIKRVADEGGDTNLAAGVGPQAYCKPFRFIGGMVPEPEGFWEILFSPGRVTITSELGWLRRIHTDGRKLPSDLDESNMGTSIAHWEGNMLVIETAGLNHTAMFAYRGSVAAPIGRNARSTERVFLKEPDLLQVDSMIVAPESLTEPYKTKVYLRRVRGHVPQESSYCVENDPQIDPVTGAQRFDLTPPADLPPPPSTK